MNIYPDMDTGRVMIKTEGKKKLFQLGGTKHPTTIGPSENTAGRKNLWTKCIGNEISQLDELSQSWKLGNDETKNPPGQKIYGLIAWIAKKCHRVERFMDLFVTETEHAD